jgi:hypothetical protein
MHLNSLFAKDSPSFMKSLDKEEFKGACDRFSGNQYIDDNSFDQVKSSSGRFVPASTLPRETKLRSMPLYKREDHTQNVKQIKIKYSANKFIKLIDAKETVSKMLKNFKDFLQKEKYIKHDNNTELCVKDNDGFIVDKEIICESLNLNQVFEVIPSNAVYSNKIVGRLELLDIPDSVLDIKNEDGKWMVKVSWRMRKDGVIPESCFLTEDSLIKFQPRFLFDFYSTFAKSIISNKK